MNRLASTLLLTLICPLPLAAQSQVGSAQVAERFRTIVMPPPLVAADTAFAGQTLVERAVVGAIVGAVTGAALGAQGSECVDSASPARAMAVGGLWGAIRGALRWSPREDSPLDTNDNGGKKEGPFPFDVAKCARK